MRVFIVKCGTDYLYPHDGAASWTPVKSKAGHFFSIAEVDDTMQQGMGWSEDYEIIPVEVEQDALIRQ